jgi:hypothetical protein
MTIHDDGAKSALPPPKPDPHGQAALLLAESLLHKLMERSVLSAADAIDVVETAAEVKLGLANEKDESADGIQASVALLFSIADSIATDLPSA